MPSSARVIEPESNTHNSDSMHLMVQNLRTVGRFHGENAPAPRASNSIQNCLYGIFSALSILLSAIGATPNSIKELALLADWHLRDICWSFGFQPAITQALYVSLLATSGSACVFLMGIIVFLLFSCAAGISGLVSVAGGLLWGIAVGGAGGTAIMGVSFVAPTFVLSILGAVIIGLVGAASAPKRLHRDDQSTSHRIAASGHSTVGTTRRERQQIPMLQLPSSFTETLQAVGSMANLHQERRKHVNHQGSSVQRPAPAAPNSSESLDGTSSLTSFMVRNVRSDGAGNTSSTAMRDLHVPQSRMSTSRRTQLGKEAGVQDDSAQGNCFEACVNRVIESSAHPNNASIQRNEVESVKQVESSSLPQPSKQARVQPPTRRVADVPSLWTRGDITRSVPSSGADSVSGWPPASWGEVGGACSPPLSARSREALVHGRAVLL
jgi:hypothetical protein